MPKKAIIILADGFEEIEAVTVIDVLRRAGVDLKVVGLTGKAVKGAHDLTMEADLTLAEYDGSADAVILPGGMPGSKNLNQSRKVAELVQSMNEKGKLVGAICAAPALALAPAGVLEGRKATCYPGFQNNFSSDVKFTEESVVVDRNIVTSRGPGTAMEFALNLAERLAGKAEAQKLREGLLVS